VRVCSTFFEALRLEFLGHDGEFRWRLLAIGNSTDGVVVNGDLDGGELLVG
jgi:hypothetical protein